VLQNRLLAPILGIADPRTSKRIDFVGGSRGPGELVSRVDRGGGVAFSLFPVTVAEVMEISDAGQIMPPRSTWFEPSCGSGLFIHSSDAGAHLRTAGLPGQEALVRNGRGARQGKRRREIGSSPLRHASLAQERKYPTRANHALQFASWPPTALVCPPFQT